MTSVLKCMGGEAMGVKQDGMKDIFPAMHILCYNIWIMFRDNCIFHAGIQWITIYKAFGNYHHLCWSSYLR